jgi:superfamily I DNA/RNA helicase
MLESAWWLYMDNKKEVKHEAIKLLGDWDALLESAKDSHEIKMVVKRIERYQGGIPSLVKDIKEASGVRERDADVVISTAHKAKGLEWDTVKLSDDFPDPMTWDKNDERWKVREDELNLLYVATTRARRTLHGNNVLKLAIASRDFDKAA